MAPKVLWALSHTLPRIFKPFLVNAQRKPVQSFKSLSALKSGVLNLES